MAVDWDVELGAVLDVVDVSKKISRDFCLKLIIGVSIIPLFVRYKITYMKKNTLGLIFLLFTFPHTFSHSQSFYGKVVDVNDEPLSFANVILQTAQDSVFVDGTVTDENGEFILKTDSGRLIDRYILKISFIGYETYKKPILGKQESNLGEIVLRTSNTRLPDITVEAQLPKIKFSNGRYIADIEHSIAATGNTIESLLVQLPGVWATSDGNITINGIGGARVYINERAINLSGAALMRYLSTLRSEDISRIEVIPRPSAEIEAEGSGGIIRIITKQTRNEGWSGMLGTRTDIQRFWGLSPYANLKYDKGKFGASLSMNAQKAKWLMFYDNFSRDDLNGSIYDAHNNDTILDKNYSANLNLYYDVNSRNKIALNLSYLYWGKDEHITGNTNISGDLMTDISQTESDRNDQQDMHHYSVTLNYDLLLDSVGKNKLTFLADFSNQYQYDIKNFNNYLNRNNSGNMVSREDLLNDQGSPYRICSAEVRYAGSCGNYGSALTGLKYSDATIKNRFANYENISGIWKLNPEVGYDYQYDEQLISGYFQYTFKRDKWSLEAGIRGEYTDGQVIGFNEPYRRFDLFPSVYYDYRINDSHRISLSYAKRIKRINYMRLLPQRYYSTRYTILEGNPDLKPDMLNNIGINYSIAGKYYFSATYSWSNNALSAYTKSDIIEDRSVLISTYIDGIKQQNFNFNVYVPLTFAPWWNSINQANGYYNRFQTSENNFSNFSYDIFTQHNFIFPKHITGEILYRYMSESKSAYSINYPYHLLNAALQKSFLNDKLNLKIEASRILYHQKMGSETKTPEAFTKTSMYYTQTPFFGITLTYSFSKGKVQNRQKIQHSNEQEKNRTY
jgi:hypothetical protein